MRNISLGQITILLLFCFLMFGDFFSLKKKLNRFVQLNRKKYRKKGN